MPAFSPKFPRSLLRIAGWLSPAALQLHYFPLQLLEVTPGGTIARRARFHRIAGLIFRRTTFADRQVYEALFGAVVGSVNAHNKNLWAPVCDSGFRRVAFFHNQSGGEVMAISLNVNGKAQQVDVPEEMPLLWVLRDTLGLTGTKFGCGMAQCGACTVHVNGMAMRSCALPVGSVSGPVVTIEGLSKNGDHPLQKAWVKNNVPQCGYCQAGQIMQGAALLKNNPKPSDADIEGAMSGNICRCGTYTRIRAAIKEAAGVQS